MTTMNISLPAELKHFVDQQVGARGYSSSSEYVRELIRREQDREALRTLLLQGLASGPGRIADSAYFEALRRGLRDQAAEATADEDAPVRPPSAAR
jgi:antitoxin ParD1/3/4